MRKGTEADWTRAIGVASFAPMTGKTVLDSHVALAVNDELTRLRTENADLRAEAQIAASVAKTNEDALRATLKQAREALMYGVRKMNHLGEALGCMPLHNAIQAIDKVQP